MNKQLGVAAYLLGAAVLAWVGWGYGAGHPLALTMTVLIAACYGAGGLELRRFHRSTLALSQALAGLKEPVQPLGDWLASLPPALQGPVRQRVEGERVPLPGPVMVPYLVGLLVLLGMLGTFLGMVVTLKGAVLALESSTDLATIRTALSAPVKGLGLAFGTSVAGVAASAMLGLVSALCRRERLQAGQLLDSRIATVLRRFSRVQQREDLLLGVQAQSAALPAVVDQLQALMTQLAEHSTALGARLQADQARFHDHASAAYGELARSVDRSLQHSLSESARLAGAAIQPVVEATMSGLARESTALRSQLVEAAQQQLDSVAERFERTVGKVAQGWTEALARHEQFSGQLHSGLAESLAGFNDSFDRRASAVLSSVEGTHLGLRQDLAQTLAALRDDTRQLHQALASYSQKQAAALLDGLAQAQTEAQAQAAAADLARQSALADQLAALATTLHEAWRQAGEAAQQQQQALMAGWAENTQALQAQARAETSATLAEVNALMRTAGEAPRAAADVIAQMRDQLSASLARDNALLDERSRIMATLDTLLASVQHAATEQRGAIDALVASARAVLDEAGRGFQAQLAAQRGTLDEVAAQISVSAVDVASLGESFGAAVQQFGTANEALLAQLQRIEAALGKSTARSDEQLAYYVAQARELIDLSLSSQQQIVADLQQLGARAEVPALGGAA